jgi:hypothetical protein
MFAKGLNFTMHLMSFHVNGRQGSSRTKILAGTTTNATLHVDRRDEWRVIIILVERHHLYGPHGAMPGTISTLHLVGDSHAVFLHPYGMSDLD